MTWAACVGLSSVRMRHVVVKGGGSRLPYKWREAWRHGPFTERGRGAVFKASTPHDHGVGSGRLTRPLGSACRHVSPMRLGWQTVQVGNRAVAGWGGGSVLAPCAFCILIGRAGRPSPNPDPL